MRKFVVLCDWSAHNDCYCIKSPHAISGQIQTFRKELIAFLTAHTAWSWPGEWSYLFKLLLLLLLMWCWWVRSIRLSEFSNIVMNVTRTEWKLFSFVSLFFCFFFVPTASWSLPNTHSERVSGTFVRCGYIIVINQSIWFIRILNTLRPTSNLDNLWIRMYLCFGENIVSGFLQRFWSCLCF